MESVLNILERLALRVSRFISNLAGIAVLWIIAVTCIDVIGRYFFNSPLYAGAEMVQVSMAFVIFFSLPGMFFKNEHIIVDLFSFFKTGIINIRIHIGWLLGGIFLVVTAYCIWIIAGKTYSYAQRSLEDGDTYEYIMIPALALDHSPYLPKYLVDTFIALALFFTLGMIILRLFILISRPNSSAEIED